MKKYIPFIQLFFLTTVILSPGKTLAQAERYFPESNLDWMRKSPSEAGMDSVILAEAIALAKASETANSPNMEINHYQTFGREPFGFGIGPFKERGAQTGIIMRHGYIIAAWGNPSRVDMTHSITKSFLSSTIGIAFDEGLIRDVHDEVAPYMAPIFFDEAQNPVTRAGKMGDPLVFEPFVSAHNKQITWDHLLRQTSDWEGTLWGKPDWADRPSGDRYDWMDRPRNEPGTVWEYNDVRVNLLALAGTNLFRRPIQDILKERIMDPIGASGTWRWMGYQNSWIILDGKSIQIPSGGGHWGGGMFISAYDQARFGYLTLNLGRWKDRQILSREWIDMAMTPTPSKDTYGFMNWFLNSGQQLLPSAPSSAFYHAGAGVNRVYVDREHDLVVVLRWIDGSAMDAIIGKILESIGKED
jgi:hypothetical protein